MDKSIFSLQDKNIWVFGGAGYLGQPLVLLLAELGAKVLCVDLSQNASFFIESLSISRSSITPESLDIRDTSQLKTFISRYVERTGIPDGLVNLTFASTAKKMEDLNEDDFNYANNGGITSSFILSKEIGTLMAKKGKGSIVLFASMYGMNAPYPDVYKEPMNKNPIEYGVGKAGIIQMTRYMAVHWGKQSVRCNCISPGPFPNKKIQKENPDFVQRLSDKSPMGRIGQSTEIAGAAAFLLSDAASYITGHNLIVDGGWTCW
jgi:NAD(P)-dependent dehydrogenase (short-subunit alcohol dehydrogenase family)